MGKFICLTLSLNALLLGSSVKGDGNKIYNVSLNGDSSINLHWIIDYKQENVIFEVHLPSDYGWFAVGFSDYGHLFPADYCLLWKNLERKVSLQDTYADEKGIIHLDKRQDCKEFKQHLSDGISKFTFTRKFDTCDQNDYVIENGTTHIVWSKGKKPLYQVNGMNISASREEHGMSRVQLLKNTAVNLELPSHVKILDVVTNQVNVPGEETTYWCQVFKLPDEYKTKHHIYQYVPHIQETSEGVVHHMEVFQCVAPPDEEIPLYVGNCFAKDRPLKTQVCKRVLAAWAMGAPAFTYPEEAGLPFGGENFNPYIMLEIHYNNPELRKGLVDSSGVRIYLSSVLKKMDAGIIELGLEYTDKMAIPPGQTSFSLAGYCTSDCTATSLPSNGITIFGSQLHTHGTGIRVKTRHFNAKGIELPELNRDNHYSTHFQEIRRLKRPVTVLPGHSLITTCDFNTEDRENITLGGFSITDEMCVNYVHYYPDSELEVCKSSISDEALKTFFKYMNEWEDQHTSPNKGISDNYKSIEWNKMRVQLLDELYKESPISMQCNMSTGDRFPGSWDNSLIPQIAKALPPPTRNCGALRGY